MDSSCFIHYTIDEKQWENEFKGQIYFSHGKTDSCRVV